MNMVGDGKVSSAAAGLERIVLVGTGVSNNVLEVVVPESSPFLGFELRVKAGKSADKRAAEEDTIEGKTEESCWGFATTTPGFDTVGKGAKVETGDRDEGRGVRTGVGVTSGTDVVRTSVDVGGVWATAGTVRIAVEVGSAWVLARLDWLCFPPLWLFWFSSSLSLALSSLSSSSRRSRPRAIRAVRLRCASRRLWDSALVGASRGDC